MRRLADTRDEKTGWLMAVQFFTPNAKKEADTKYAGRFYRIGRPPVSRVANDAASWDIIATVLKHRGVASFEHLAAAAFGHEHYRGSLSFVRYCVRSGWLVEVKQEGSK